MILLLNFQPKIKKFDKKKWEPTEPISETLLEPGI